MKEFDPRTLLNNVLVLIANDIKHIHAEGSLKKLSHDSSMDLARYATTLLSITKDYDQEREKKKKTFATMTNEELAAAAEEALKELKK